MITEYDPLQAPDPNEWLALDEAERINLVVAHHQETDEDIPDIELHAAFHVMVENQAAMGDELPVQNTLERLMAEGLDRHNAVHAVASVLIKYLWNMGPGGEDSDSFSNDYMEEVRELTAQKWYDDYRDME